jgi:GxxExxY protein
MSGAIIGCAFTVLNTLGAGFLEKVYENALALELREARLAVAQQHDATVASRGAVVGEYFVDLMIEDAVLVELKAVKALEEVHRLQCLNDLNATGLQLCRLLNRRQSAPQEQARCEPPVKHFPLSACSACIF